jgi:hypothetical protein
MNATAPFPRLPGPATILIGCFLAWLALWNLERALPAGVLLDFGSFYESGAAARAGNDPYGLYPLTFHVVFGSVDIWNPNLNPPAALPLFDLLSRLDPNFAFRLWWCVSFGSFALTVALLVKRLAGDAWVLPTLWAAALAGFCDTMVLGQIYTPLALAAALGWLWMERRPWLAGLAIGVLVAVKPNFLVWPVLLVLAGHRRPALGALLSFAVLSAFPVALYGPTVYRQWADVVAGDVVGRVIFLSNASLAGLLLRAGVERTVATALGFLTLLPLAWIAWRRRPDGHAASALGLVGGIVASPIAWVHYTLFLMPLFLAAPRRPLRVAAALLILVPVPFVLGFMEEGPLIQASVGSAHSWAMLLALADVVAVALWKSEPVQREGAGEADQNAGRHLVRPMTEPVA